MNPSQNLRNSFYFKKILKFCSLNIRSYTEISTKLEKFDRLELELKREIIEYFLKIKVVLNDDDFVKYYLENLSDSQGYTYNQLFLKLSKKVSNLNNLSQDLKSFFSKTEDDQIQKFINKNYRKLSRIDDARKRIQYLTNRGFKFELVKKHLKINDL